MSSTASDIPRPRFARMYLGTAARAERRGAGDHRRTLLAGVHGRVVEIGAGNGLNFPHYPPEVSEVVAVEPEPTLRAEAERAAAQARANITVLPGVADELPLADASVDAAVASLVLCSVPDQSRALGELRRVLRPGGVLRFYEHVLASGKGRAWIQNRVAWFWPLVGGGCHPNRDTVSAIERAGFDIERCERFCFQPVPLAIPVTPHVIGAARKPG
jgi:ubiquinone/menaquinone biosynthesis C-methylase UbiE